MVSPDEINSSLNAHHEWLLVRDFGRTFPLDRSEIVVDGEHGKTFFGFLDDAGFHSKRVTDAAVLDGEIRLDLATGFGKERETVRLVSRVAASELAVEVEIARLKTANEIAKLIETSFVSCTLGRVALNADNGRIAQIEFESENRQPLAAIADVTGKISPETLITSAMMWLEKLGARKKKPTLEIWIIGERARMRIVQKLHALMSERWKAKITVLYIDRKIEPPRLVPLPARRIAELWREKPRKLALPPALTLSNTARAIIAASPDAIDVVVSKQGETLRFHGLPIVRVRPMRAGRDSAWFGVGNRRQILSQEKADDFIEMVRELESHRTCDASNKRHDLYRAAPEAWLESILRRNIKLLDSNLILSPIYNQFRSANDKIDLLALRRDGRLVVIELKTQPNREAVFQAADYWRKIELLRRRGTLAAANLFEGREIKDESVLVYLVAPAWSFHRDFEFFAASLAPEIELWRWELHEKWREKIEVLARINYSAR